MLAPLPAAIIFSGQADAKAPNITSTILCPVWALAAEAEGNAALTIVPSGAMIEMGSSIP